MFTGIIEELGTVVKMEEDHTNIHFWIEAPFTTELQIDQSVCHNGVCLTVVEIVESQYKVTAIKETLEKSNLGTWQMGSVVNLERCMQLNGRLDGHIVQGHVDTTGKLVAIENKNGSYLLTIEYNANLYVTVEKGSITVNGISLTVVNSQAQSFSIALIPYTWEHTNLHTLAIGDTVNLEFDIIGKYIERLMQK